MAKTTKIEKMVCEVAAVCKALADPARVMVVYHCAQKGQLVTAAELREVLGVDTPAAGTYHLKLLVDAGVLRSPKRGWYVIRPDFLDIDDGPWARLAVEAGR